MTGLNIKGGVQHDLILQVCLGVASTKRELLEGNRLALHPICGGGGGGGLENRYCTAGCFMLSELGYAVALWVACGFCLLDFLAMGKKLFSNRKLFLAKEGVKQAYL